MANRFPLIFNSGAGQIQELAASDNLDLTSSNLVNAGILFTSSGSATAPSLQIGSGTTYNPGLYSPGTDQVAVATNGTRRLLIDSAGALTLDTGDATIYGVRVGRGGGAISTNTAVGASALSSNTSGANNTAIGNNALRVNTANVNTAVGDSALYSCTTGALNVAIGPFALYSNISGASNIAIGHDALYFNTATSNIAIGTNALKSTTTGGGNIGIGDQVLLSNTTGTLNTVIGGRNTAYDNTTGSNNVVLGDLALRFNTTGSNNTCIGINAGYNLTTGSNNTIIGNVLGTAGLADTVIIGAGAAERLRIDSSGRVGIGTTGPLAKLDVISSTLPQVYFSSSETDGSTKYLSIANRQRNSAAEPEGVSVIAAECSAGDNGVYIGGYLGELNAATVIKMYTANNLTTRSGTERFSINSTGTTTLTSAAATAPFVANIGASEAARIDSSGRLLVGTSNARSNVYNTTYAPQIQLEGNDNSNSALSIISCFNGTSIGGQLILGKANSGSVGVNGIVASGNPIGRLSFQGNDGSEFVEGAAIIAEVDGTPGANDMPGRLVFSTTADGGSSPNTSPPAMTIKSSQEVLIGTSTITANGGILQLKSGITFPATAVAASDPNTLDDYEEGTWTPAYTGFTTNSGTLTAVATYVKIGLTVMYQWQQTGGNISTSAGAFITGLPFLFGAAGLTYGGGAASNGGTESSIVSFYQGNADRFAQLITAMSSMTGLSWSGITRLSP